MAGYVARNIRKLYVGNIPWTVGNLELKNYFNKFGPVSTATVIFDKATGLSRNYGFVYFRNKEHFDTVLNSEPHKLEGNNLKVYPSTQNSSE